MDQYLMVSTVAVFIENRLQSAFDYAELEKATGFSLPHIRAVYAKLTGKSLSRYVLSRRIANAAFEIVHSEQNILGAKARADHHAGAGRQARFYPIQRRQYRVQ